MNTVIALIALRVLVLPGEAPRGISRERLERARQGGDESKSQLIAWLLSETSKSNVNDVLAGVSADDRWLLPAIEQILTGMGGVKGDTIALYVLWDKFPDQAAVVSKRAIAANSPQRAALAIYLIDKGQGGPEAVSVLESACKLELKQTSPPQWGLVVREVDHGPELRIVYVCSGSAAESIGLQRGDLITSINFARDGASMYLLLRGHSRRLNMAFTRGKQHRDVVLVR